MNSAGVLQAEIMEFSERSILPIDPEMFKRNNSGNDDIDDLQGMHSKWRKTLL